MNGTLGWNELTRGIELEDLSFQSLSHGEAELALDYTHQMSLKFANLYDELRKRTEVARGLMKEGDRGMKGYQME